MKIGLDARLLRLNFRHQSRSENPGFRDQLPCLPVLSSQGGCNQAKQVAVSMPSADRRSQMAVTSLKL